ncbi:MAG TPA: 1-phosphofructokinase family hexose kinase, partial [Xanthobacteraceae bacterium]|nr:1-phosphofructokinase family hexose kinase [Xanthobacteraceae bacterium]
LMAREGIASRTSELAEETREDFTVTETDTGQQYRFVLPGPHLTGSEWQACLETLAACGPGPRWLVASGSLAPGLPEDFYARIRRIADAWGARMALDTSGPALAAALKEGVYLIKPNLRELGEFVGRPLRGESDWAEAARQVIASGHTEVVALTLGHLGALLATREGVWRAPPLPVTPVSAVGAGDSFLGAMVHGLAAGRTVVDAFRLGVAAGSAALLSAGTGLARCEDIDRLYPTVAAEPL